MLGSLAVPYEDPCEVTAGHMDGWDGWVWTADAASSAPGHPALCRSEIIRAIQANDMRVVGRGKAIESAACTASGGGSCRCKVSLLELEMDVHTSAVHAEASAPLVGHGQDQEGSTLTQKSKTI